jgi:hypothetical protein
MERNVVGQRAGTASGLCVVALLLSFGCGRAHGPEPRPPGEPPASSAGAQTGEAEEAERPDVTGEPQPRDGSGHADGEEPARGPKPAGARKPGRPEDLLRSTGEELGPPAPYRVREARMEGDVLVVTVQYGGGCREHRFTFAWPGAFLESNPVQTPLVLHHDDGGGDPCRALPMETLRQDLSPIREAYQAAYRTQHGTVVVVLQGAGTSVRYDF